jgi:hypothetical protein
VGPARIEIVGEHWFGRTIRGAAVAPFGGTISLSSAGASGCFVAARGGFEVAPCAGIELGDLHGVGLTDIPLTTDGWWVAVVAGIHSLAHLVGPLWAGLRIEGIAPLVRDRFVADINGQTTLLFRSSAIAGRAFFGPELRF